MSANTTSALSRFYLYENLKPVLDSKKQDSYSMQPADYVRLFDAIYQGEARSLESHRGNLTEESGELTLGKIGKTSYNSAPFLSENSLALSYSKMLSVAGPIWVFQEKLNYPYFSPACFSTNFILPQFGSRFHYSTLKLDTDSLFDDNAILNFAGDPDDENFVPCSKDTLERAKKFMSAYAAFITVFSFIPKILPGPDGSVDIHWKNEKKELLVNIPANPDLQATFYGDDYAKNFIRGAAHIGKMEVTIASWLLS